MYADEALMRMALAQTWQVAVLAVLVAIGVRCLAGNRPHLAHALWLVVLLKCVTPPVVGSPAGIFSWVERALAAREVPMAQGAILAAPLSSRVVDPSPETWIDSPAGDDRAEVVAELSQGKVLSASEVRRFSPRAALWVVWISGCVAIVVWTGTRTLRCWRAMKRRATGADEELKEIVERLRRQLGVRCQVRLLVTAAPIGPAVVGLVRPTVVLPAALVQSREAAALAPIVAHELAHVRRGDLWVSLLQLTATAAWWFHPWVWWSGKRIVREAERCCDEEVLATLGCSPREYARSLLGVLELKRALVAVPAFPGVRPVEITSQRLERIMQMGQGGHRRAPWWCWLATLLVAAVALPGAAYLVSADDAAVVQPSQKVADTVAAYSSGQPEASSASNRVFKLEVVFLSGPPAEIDELTAGVSTTEVLHTRIESVDPLEPGFVFRQAAAHGDKDHRVGGVFTQQLSGVFELLDEVQNQQVMDRAQIATGIQVKRPPCVRVADLQQAVIEDVAHAPFVVDAREVEQGVVKPVVRLVHEGTQVLTRPVWNGDSIYLNVQAIVSSMVDVKEREIALPSGAVTIQQPRVLACQIHSVLEVPLGRTLYLRGLGLKQGKRSEVALAMLIKLELDEADEQGAANGVGLPAGETEIAGGDGLLIRRWLDFPTMLESITPFALASVRDYNWRARCANATGTRIRGRNEPRANESNPSRCKA